MRRVNESLSVCTCTVISERDRWHQPCVPEREDTGEDEEHRDEVLAVSITPEQYEKPGHEVSGGGPERNVVE
jgi:hypothetical protein